MGWFWADSSALTVATPPQGRHSAPPPGCPMHTGSNSRPAKTSPTTADSSSACPYNPPKSESDTTPSYISKLNPLNYMPSNISNERHSSHQSVRLPLEREASTIPRGNGEGTWEYPSPQQMYNAMLRKGYTDTPAEHVESMVAVHNFLNEGAWEEIRQWERRFSRGLGQGWDMCRYGEEGAEKQMILDELRRRRKGQTGDDPEPNLLRFTGRPDEPTPKARILSLMAYIYPAKFPENPPFDRHDWFVQRHMPDGKTREVRYVIDYYSGPPEPTGEPVFFLDVRPAVDGPTAACERLIRWGGDVWWRASGGVAREQAERAKARR